MRVLVCIIPPFVFQWIWKTKLEEYYVRSNFLFHFSFLIRKIKNPILVFHFSIDEQKLENEFVICFPCALKIKWSPLFVNTRNTWYGASGRCWCRLRARLSYLVGVKRWKIYQINWYPNARRFSVRRYSIERFCVENGIRK